MAYGPVRLLSWAPGHSGGFFRMSANRERKSRRGAWLAPIACAVVLCSAVATAKPPPPLPASTPAAEQISAAGLRQLHAFVRETTGADGYPGGVVLIARHGRIVDWRAYGHRDLARRAPMRRDAIFRLYSMSKTVASVAVMMLVDDGRIALDDPVSRYLPEFAHPRVVAGGSVDAPVLRDAASPITIRELLTHTAGFPSTLPGDATATALQEREDPHGAADLRGFAERLARAPLAADPGTRFGYDGAAIEVAARIVEVASGESFGDFLQRRLFVPLRMRDTGFSVPPAQRARVVDLTTIGDDGRLRIADGPSAATPGAALNRYDSGAGGLYSTAADYARFCQMLLDGGTLDDATILAPETVDLMMHNQLTMLPRPVTQFSDSEGFGIGGSVLLDVANRDTPGSVGRYGWPGAASTTYTIDRKEGLVAILLLQHLPRSDVPAGVRDLPRVSRDFYARVYAALAR